MGRNSGGAQLSLAYDMDHCARLGNVGRSCLSRFNGSAPILDIGLRPRIWVGHAMGAAVLVGTWANLESRSHTWGEHPAHRLWHVSARKPTWLIEDGWHGEVWMSSSKDSVKAANLVHHLGLSHVEWNTTWKGPNATKSQPPCEVWDLGQNPSGTCEVSLGVGISSISEVE